MTTTMRVLKWSVPVDDQEHKIGVGPVVHVACQYGPESVQVWTLECVDGDFTTWPKQTVRAFGTGQPIPEGWYAVGSASAAGGALIWHLFAAPATCRVCGCTDESACPTGCWWVEPDLCSRCGDGS